MGRGIIRVGWRARARGVARGSATPKSGVSESRFGVRENRGDGGRGEEDALRPEMTLSQNDRVGMGPAGV